jgi:hypothetical protein
MEKQTEPRKDISFAISSKYISIRIRSMNKAVFCVTSDYIHFHSFLCGG